MIIGRLHSQIVLENDAGIRLASEINLIALSADRGRQQTDAEAEKEKQRDVACRDGLGITIWRFR
jgi:hypothetical protein